jgi:hypothetical protein
MTELEKYYNYWDKWHKKWHASALKGTFKNNSVCKWALPTEKSGNYINPNPIWRYFPEPFWAKAIKAKVLGMIKK